MKKLTFAFLFLISLTSQAQTWIKELMEKNRDIIDTIMVANDDKGWANALKMKSFQIYYHQPLDHNNPDGEQFQLRATLVTRNVSDVLTRPMHVFASGYNIHEYNWKNPSYYVGEGSKNTDFFEIATHLKANVLSIEHRYFDGSFPENGNFHMEYCTAEQAAADFHALFEAFKKVFTCKWVMSGISKGGTTTFMQHAFYPDDMDLYFSYVGPLCDTPNDSRVMRYYKKHSWTPELNERVNAYQRDMLTDPEVYRQYSEWIKTYHRTWSQDRIKQEFLNSIGLMDFNAHMTGTAAEMKAILDKDDITKAELLKKGYTKSYLFANMAFYRTLNSTDAWDWLNKSSSANTRANGGFPIPEKPVDYIPFAPFSISGAAYDKTITAYYYQAQNELGTYGYDFGAILEDKDSLLADSLNAVWERGDLSIAIGIPSVKGVKYSSDLRNKVIEATKNAEKPMIFLFGGDDAWTGGMLPDECYNEFNTFKVILPNQNHSACISKASKADQTYVWNLVDDALAGKFATGITEISSPSSTSETMYNLQGQRITSAKPGTIYIKGGKKYMK